MSVPTQSASGDSPLVGFVRSQNFKYVVGGLLCALGLLMLIGFFAFNWLDYDSDRLYDNAIDFYKDADAYVEFWANENGMSADEYRDEQIDYLKDVKQEAADTDEDDKELETAKVSAWQLWTGRDGKGEETTSLTRDGEDSEDKGFGAVALLDRFLILLPIGAIALIAVAALYMLGRLDEQRTFIVLLVLAILLFLFPYFWQAMKTADWKADTRERVEANLGDEVNDEFLDQAADLQAIQLTSFYSTGEQRLLGFLAILVVVAAWGLKIADGRGMLGAPSAETAPPMM